MGGPNFDKELRSIGVWCLNGAVRAMKNRRLTNPDGYKEEMLWQIAWNDEVQLFIKCCCDQSPIDAERAGVKTLYETFKKWATEYAIRVSWKQIGMREFSSRVERFGYTKKRQGRATTFNLSILGENEWWSFD